VDSLFPAGRPTIGATETAAQKVLAQWRRAGHDIDPLLSSMMRGAAGDVDRALADYRNDRAGVFPVTRARALLLDAYWRAVPDTPATDAVDDALVQLLADADAAAG